MPHYGSSAVQSFAGIVVERCVGPAISNAIEFPGSGAGFTKKISEAYSCCPTIPYRTISTNADRSTGNKPHIGSRERAGVLR